MITLTITKGRFLDWYFNSGQDQEMKESKMDLAKSIIHQMYSVGHGSMSVEEIFDGCNQDAIRIGFTEEYDEQRDEYEVELSDLGIPYTITLI